MKVICVRFLGVVQYACMHACRCACARTRGVSSFRGHKVRVYNAKWTGKQNAEKKERSNEEDDEAAWKRGGERTSEAERERERVSNGGKGGGGGEREDPARLVKGDDGRVRGVKRRKRKRGGFEGERWMDGSRKGEGGWNGKRGRRERERGRVDREREEERGSSSQRSNIQRNVPAG